MSDLFIFDSVVKSEIDDNLIWSVAYEREWFPTALDYMECSI